jgi:hypothetical protein
MLLRKGIRICRLAFFDIKSAGGKMFEYSALRLMNAMVIRYMVGAIGTRVEVHGSRVDQWAKMWYYWCDNVGESRIP